MNRREFVAASLGASFSASLGSAGATPGGVTPKLLELRRYGLRFGNMQARFLEYQGTVLVPALNRAGIQPVGAFAETVGPDTPAVQLLLPHPDAASIATLGARLAADEEYRRGAADFRSLPASDPPYVRRDSSLMIAFDTMPNVEAPSGRLAASSRMFELRTYESHNEGASAKKVEMFEKGGEISIFRRTGLTPVFFGRNLIGPSLPSLTYMLVFADAEAREKAWAEFGGDPGWQKLRTTPGFTDPEILSRIGNTLLRPTGYSQI
jgi:NIPSNAP